MNDFTASNGVRVRLQDRDLDVSPPNASGSGHLGWMGLAGGYIIDALREFFRAEEDERLGRWRFPEKDYMVVYADESELHVVDERDGAAVTFSRECRRKGAPLDRFHAAAAGWLDAHPDPKPWHEAKPGEVWVLEVEDETPGVPWLVKQTSSHSYFARLEAPPSALTYGVRCAQITAGRRIWPEVSA